MRVTGDCGFSPFLRTAPSYLFVKNAGSPFFDEKKEEAGWGGGGHVTALFFV